MSNPIPQITFGELTVGQVVSIPPAIPTRLVKPQIVEVVTAPTPCTNGACRALVALVRDVESGQEFPVHRRAELPVELVKRSV
ncbi:hypothetical protein [Microtetraspora niveoalba]|uniref:hypothetical protein n=1 Tax=Microtetraspora niveoalba TaxID=46175 RepID=UPI00082E94D2|nr:hypothetical protein [Microtetraspora niveoalba]